MIGIYCIENVINHKKYIGQSADIISRWGKHKNFLRNNKHCNKKLQNAWNLYGEQSFNFYVLEECELDNINDREIYWIDFYNCINDGYNLCFGGDGIRGYKHTEEEICKMIQVQHPEPVYQISFDHCIIEEFPSASKAAKKFHLSARTIKDVCRRKNHQHTLGGYIWVWKKEYDNGLVDWDYYDNFPPISPIPVKCFSFEGLFIKEYSSMYSTKGDGFDSSLICSCISRGLYRSQGYIWIKSGEEYVFEKTIYSVLCTSSGNIEEFDFRCDVAKKYNIGTQTMDKYIQNGKEYKGHIYKKYIKKIICK